MPQPLVWTQVKQTGQVPSARSGHTIVSLGKTHLLFGGVDADKTEKKNGKIGPNNQLYVLKVAVNQVEWKLQPCTGDIPLPRSSHAACAIAQDKMLIFGGFYTSTLRFNDTFILKTQNFQWVQPPNQKVTGEPKNAESKIGAPEPRGNHSATFHKNKVYVFGGHGGVGFSTKSFNDLYILDCESFEWSQPETSGTPPDPRGGHQAAIMGTQDLLMIFGGWSQVSQYQNVMIYDIEKKQWIDPEISHETPKWNMTAIIVPCIPSWKYFIFGGSVGNFEEGGNRTSSRIVDDSFYLDVDTRKWYSVQLETMDNKKPTKPKQREASAAIYDTNDSRILIFGGWSNQWMNDMWSLNVSMIVGPPYAIYSLRPQLGPLTGKTRIQIAGDGFKDSQNIVIRFSSAKSVEEVPGMFISEKELQCETPSFEKHGAKQVEVRVSINKQDYTIQGAPFKYYLNTKAEKTLAFGPGLLQSNALNVDTCFYIQARNLNDQNRESGADEFEVTIVRPDMLQKLNEERERLAAEKARLEDEAKKGGARKGDDEDNEYQQDADQEQGDAQPKKSYEEDLLERTYITPKIFDRDDGSYLVTYQVTEPCKVLIEIKLKNERGELLPIRSSPKEATFEENAHAKNNQFAEKKTLQDISFTIGKFQLDIEQWKSAINIKDRNVSDDVKKLLEVMSNLSQIEHSKESLMLKLDECEQTLRTLANIHEVRKESELNHVKKLQDEWKNLIKIAQTVDKDISGPKKQEKDKTKEKIKKFEDTLKEYNLSLKKENFYAYKTGIEDSTRRINEIKNQILEFEFILKDYDNYAKMFEFPDETQGCQRTLELIRSEVNAVMLLWQHIRNCDEKFTEYRRLRWAGIDSNEMEDEIKKFRKYLVDMKGIDKRSNAFVGISDDLKKWAVFIPLLSELKDPAMNTSDGRHWKEVKSVVKQDFAIGDDMELDIIWNLKLFDFKERIEEIAEQAKQEAKMEKGIEVVVAFWKDVQFELIKHKDTAIQTLKMLDDHFEKLEEHQLQINNMLLSKYVKQFEKEVEKWKQDLGAVYDVIQLLSEVQKTWSFLENLFIQSEEVKKELPTESKQFIQIDEAMKSIMAQGAEIRNVLQFCTVKGMLKTLEKIQLELKVCEKALNEFLDSKRKAFPRFYFVSVNDLLDILSNGNSPAKINRHMSKIFQAIDNLKLQEHGPNDRPSATAMITCVGFEEVNLTKHLKLEGKVERYLDDMINTMITTLRDVATLSLKIHPANPESNNKDRRAWIEKDASQITLLVNNVVWSGQVEECFKKIAEGDMNSMKDFYKKSVELLTELIRFVRGDLAKPLRQKLMCLITMDTHSRDMVDKLIQEHVRKPDEFQWQSQLKFYWPKDDCVIRIADAVFKYSYEYLGNGPRLVVTPLTDRIYVTATQALHLKMGCAPAGPAGTGKTETTKDLANALAKACYVFNCSSEMNYESMGNIYKGLASSGCWGCFDEFNRLLPEVLSVCSVQFKAVTDAIKMAKERFMFPGGGEITLDPTCGVFITMNPGYLGRAELPEGLKALFRPITVVVPDLELICENMLMAEGFEEAKTLAHKFVTLYMLCRDLLSKQLHYDWGLRAIKSVLVVAGGFKRSEPGIAEQALLMRALRDFNIPKIAFQDLDIFYGLLNDLFPGVDVKRKRNMDFERIIEEATNEFRLDTDPDFIMKVVQTAELLEIRHCVFVMGPPGAGKSTTWKVLAKAQDKAGKKTTLVDMDPKVVSTKDLYGYNLPTKEWKDGLLSKVMRSLAETPDSNPKWIMLDGDLDANWIESMNSVMDDNKILTLANNERIPLKPHMRMIFEIRDLRFATPATVSRAGILYISDDKGYQWRAYVKSWVKNNFSEEKLRLDLQKLFDRYIEGTLLYVKKHSRFLVPVGAISMVISLCKALYPLLQGDIKNLEYLFVYACVWAIGGALAEKDSIDYRKDFSTWWKGEWKTSVKFPSKGTIFDYFVDQSSESVKFDEWAKRLIQIDFDPTQGTVMGNITVPTKETLATSELVKSFISVQHAVLLIGNSGCGKTQIAKGILRDIVKKDPDSYSYVLINFNYYTDSGYLQSQLEQPLEKKAGRQFGPQGKGQLIYFIDDLNMPQLDPYDTQTAIALLRQHADYGHWYDVSKLQLKDIIKTQTIAAMNPSAGSFFVNPRYQRHFWTASISIPDNESLFLIYNTFLSGHLKRFKPTVQEQCPAIIKAALQLHMAVVQSFRKTAVNFHYEFNLRHISNVFQGLLLADPIKFQEPDKIVRLWVHESERTYGDRLVSSENLIIYKGLMFDLLKKSFPKFNFNRFFANQNAENLIYCNFTSGIQGDRYYDQMPNDKLQSTIDEALKDYNDNFAFMGLVLFEDALKHVCRITRIVLPPAGHALLVGVGGSGKQSLTKLAGFIMTFTTFQITISATYNMNDLRTDLQLLYSKSGLKEEQIMFLFTEGQITNERFLTYINDLLSSGEVAELYTSDEKEVIINNVRGKVKAEGKQDSRDNCWNWFIDKVKQNLHMTLCFSPVGDSLRRRARQFPALVNSTVIDWYQPWPQDALFNVAQQFLKEIETNDDNIRDSIVKFMPFSFKLVNELSLKLLEQERRYVYTTPKSFLELIKLYKVMLVSKKDALVRNRERYDQGLVKLRETQQQVSEIEVQVKEKQIEADAKKNEADKFAQVVGLEKEKVEVENSKATVEADKCAVIKQDVEQKKSSTLADLEAAQPLVEQAKAALNSIKKTDFQQAKSWANPPPGVPDVFSATIYLLAGFFPEAIEIDKNKKPKAVDWKSALKLMKSPEEFLAKLIGFKEVVDQNLVNAANVQTVKNLYLTLPHFTSEAMSAKSGAAKGVCEWVINIVKYYDVIQVIEPKRKALKEATEQLEEANRKFAEVQEVVRELNEKLTALTNDFNKAIDSKNAALAEADRCARRLNSAQRLVSALGSENERWDRSIRELDISINLLPGDVLIASAFVSYAGPFNKKFRDVMIREQFLKFINDHKIPLSPGADPVKLLTDESTAAKWNQQSLPNDIVSIENGTILTNSERYPLMIDPQLQGIKWIKEKEANNNLKVLRLGSKNTNREIEMAIQGGWSALIENMDERIDAVLMPVIARQFIIRSSGKKKIKFAGKELDVDNKFLLYLHTQLSNPHYPPEIQAEATLINFTVTEDGLGDQLLSLVVERERPDLAQKKVELIQQQNSFKIKLKELEDELLYKLANAQGDILDDIALIENLEYSKKISVEIAEKVEIAKTTEARINETSELYRPAASRGALIYFLLTDLSKIHTFYKYSLESYLVVIHRAIDNISEFKKIKTGQMINEKDYEVKSQKDGEEEGQEEEQNEVEAQQEYEQEQQAIEQNNEEQPEQQEQDEQAEGEERPEGEGEEDPEKQAEGQEEAKQEEAKKDENEPLTPTSLRKRVNQLIDSITYTSFSYARRGLFERHKLIVSTMLTLRIQLRAQKLLPEEVNHLVIGKIEANPPAMPESLKSFLTEPIWAQCKALESVPEFQGFCSSLEIDNLQWKKWYNEEKAEIADLPKAFKELKRFHRLLLLRCMRPDRLTSAMSNFVGDEMGTDYVEQKPFSIIETFAEMGPKTPIFFVLFPGVDPTPEVERVAAQYDISSSNGKFINISMGQGQEEPAKKALYQCAKSGHWIMLQNVHLMQNWLTGLNGLEGFLETVYAKHHPNFRVFISSEPPPLPDQKIIPESILQASIKVANEAPQDLKANLRRAYAHFDQEFLEKCDKKPNEFKSCLFALCFFHSLVLGRKKFGAQGWSRVYNFNDGDLTICADVLYNYLSKYEVVPWDDLKYMFAEIMYGGHITDNWDRRTNATYLKVLMKPELLQPNFNLGPNFKSPDPSKFDYEAYKNYIETRLPIESPQMFGMHPNAEIGYLTAMCETLFGTILEVQGGATSGGGGKKDDGVMTQLQDYRNRCPNDYNFLDIVGKIKGDKTPFQVVCLQEVERMNVLLGEIRKSLDDLKLGLTGALNITDSMESLALSLQFNKVPVNWEKYAYFSRKGLALWYNDLIERTNQLSAWTHELITPFSLCISYLFNPMSFLTAIMQKTAREQGQSLDDMVLQTNVTTLKTHEEVTAYPESGAYIHGLFLEGAAWELGGQGQEGYLVEQRPKELHPKLPVVNVVAVTSDKKKKIAQYECPVYVTSIRGMTYVFSANLNMESEDFEVAKWILSGTCLLMSDD